MPQVVAGAPVSSTRSFNSPMMRSTSSNRFSSCGRSLDQCVTCIVTLSLSPSRRPGTRRVIRISCERRAQQRARRYILREIDRVLEIGQPKQQQAYFASPSALEGRGQIKRVFAERVVGTPTDATESRAVPITEAAEPSGQRSTTTLVPTST